MAGPNEDFKKLQELIRETPSDKATKQQLEKELNIFLGYENDAHLIFASKQPNIDEWRIRRSNYLQEMDPYDYDDPKMNMTEDERLPKEAMWFHDMRVSVFVRKQFNVPDEKYQQLANKAKKLVPSFYWDELTQYIEHKDDTCIRGDIFNHPSRKRFEDLTLFDRGEYKQTQEMFDKYAEDHRKKLESGELGEDGDANDDGDDETETSPDEIEDWEKEAQQSSKQRNI